MKNKYSKAGLLTNDLLREKTKNRLQEKNSKIFDLYEDFNGVDPKEILAALNGHGQKFYRHYPVGDRLIHVTSSKTIDELIEEINRKDNIRGLIINAVTKEAEECEQMDLKETLEYLHSGFKFNPEDAVEICLCLNLFNDDFTQDILLENFNAQQQQKRIFSEIEKLGDTDTKRKI